MSRGLGKSERLVLDALELHQHYADFNHRWLNACAIAHFRACSGQLEYAGRPVFGRDRKTKWRCQRCGGPREISMAETESLRRAIRTLAKAGRIEAIHYPVLRARLPLTADEKEREAEEAVLIRQQVDALVKLLPRRRHRRSRSRVV
jgi:hypothetical protein